MALVMTTLGGGHFISTMERLYYVFQVVIALCFVICVFLFSTTTFMDLSKPVRISSERGRGLCDVTVCSYIINFGLIYEQFGWHYSEPDMYHLIYKHHKSRSLLVFVILKLG